MAEMDRRGFLRLAAAGLAGASSVPSRGDGAMNQATADRPNVLVLFTDDQRFGTIHALGNEQVVTPNMDRLVRTGTSFTRAAIMGGTQGAVCLPSRAMLHSGRTLFRAPDNLADVALLGETLAQAGYATFGTGKWHNGGPSYARSFADGGSIFFGGMSNHLQVPIHDFSPEGKYPKESSQIGKEFSSELFSNAAIDFLGRYDEPDPFFLYVSYTAPHDPRMAPKEYAGLYDPGDIELPPNFMPEHPFDNGEMRIRDEKLAPWPRTPDIVREHIAAYYAMITHLDAHIGRVLEALEASGRADNTLIVFAGDNGLAVGQHGLLGKQNVYEHSVRVPLIFSGPGIPQGETSEAFCYLLDIFPTLCDAIGIETPGTVEGQDLMPIIRGERAAGRESLFYAYRHLHRAVSEERYKLIEYDVNDVRTTQLFDLEEGPWETENLAEEAAHADDLERLRDRLAGWQAELDDPLAGE